MAAGVVIPVPTAATNVAAIPPPEGGLDPAAVAAQVVTAVKERQSWIFTHPDWMEMVSGRTQRIVDGEAPAVSFLPGTMDS